MNEELTGLIAMLAADPAKLRALTPDAERPLVAHLRSALAQTEESRPHAPVTTVEAACEGSAKLLTVAEAAERLAVTPRWVYRKAKTLPFARKLSRKVLRFDPAGLTRWLDKRRP